MKTFFFLKEFDFGLTACHRQVEYLDPCHIKRTKLGIKKMIDFRYQEKLAQLTTAF